MSWASAEVAETNASVAAYSKQDLSFTDGSTLFLVGLGCRVYSSDRGASHVVIGSKPSLFLGGARRFLHRKRHGSDGAAPARSASARNHQTICSARGKSFCAFAARWRSKRFRDGARTGFTGGRRLGRDGSG